MDLKELILKNNPEIKKFTQTQQYDLSRELMKERYKTGLSVEDISKLLNLSIDEYAKLELGDTSTSVDKYQNLIKVLINKNLESKKSVYLSDELDKAINESEKYTSEMYYTYSNSQENYEFKFSNTIFEMRLAS